MGGPSVRPGSFREVSDPVDPECLFRNAQLAQYSASCTIKDQHPSRVLQIFIQRRSELHRSTQPAEITAWKYSREIYKML